MDAAATPPVDPAAVAAHMFEADRASRGLGMKIVDVLAKQLGGGVAARPNPSGIGACFAVTFPR